MRESAEKFRVNARELGIGPGKRAKRSESGNEIVTFSISPRAQFVVREQFLAQLKPL
jgi:hypothetical protein